MTASQWKAGQELTRKRTNTQPQLNPSARRSTVLLLTETKTPKQQKGFQELPTH